MAGAAAVIGAVTAVVGTTATIENSAQQRRLAGQAADRQKHDADVAVMRADKQKEDDQQMAATVALRDTNRQRAAATDTSTKNGTLLTGYSGSNLGAAPSTGGKTLLGS